eukprot:COSAG05_NODE_347_length_10963_cov_157.340943_8_plen_58_part_00
MVTVCFFLLIFAMICTGSSGTHARDAYFLQVWGREIVESGLQLERIVRVVARQGSII